MISKALKLLKFLARANKSVQMYMFGRIGLLLDLRGIRKDEDPRKDARPTTAKANQHGMLVERAQALALLEVCDILAERTIVHALLERTIVHALALPAICNTLS